MLSKNAAAKRVEQKNLRNIVKQNRKKKFKWATDVRLESGFLESGFLRILYKASTRSETLETSLITNQNNARK